MRRRIVLVLVTFAALLGAFLVYSLATHEGLPGLWRYNPQAAQPSGKTTTLPGFGEFDPGKGGQIIVRDKQHRIQTIYRFSAWDKVGERFRLKDPSVEWNLRGGETVRIQAREGVVSAQDVAGRWTVRNGELSGDVWITLDRNVDPQRPPLQGRPDDAVRIHVDNLFFDGDLLTIQTDSLVNVFSREADILGRGLRLSWSEGPRELRELRIVQGEYMCVREGMDRFMREMSLPGSVVQPAAPVPAASPRAQARSRDDVWAAALPHVPVMPVGLAFAGPPAVPSNAPARTTKPKPATVADATSQPAVEYYNAMFSDNVTVTQGARYLRGAEELKLVFEFRSPKREETAGRAATQAAKSAGGDKLPGDKPLPAKPPAATGQPGEPMVITWNGPLVITPARDGERRAKRFDVTARGPRMELTDGASKAACQAFTFLSPPQRGELEGTVDEPVHLSMVSGERVIAPKVRFDRGSGVVNLDGAGSMFMPASAAAIAREGRPRTTDKPAEDVNIAWSKSVVAGMGLRPDAQAGRQREFLKSADFSGDVVVQQGPQRTLKAQELAVQFRIPQTAAEAANRMTALHAAGDVYLADDETGDFIKSKVLDVKMDAAADSDRIFPRLAVATGDVSARQEKTEITSETLTVTFNQVKDEKSGQLRVRPIRLESAGTVHIIDRTGNDLVVADGASVISDLVARTAVLGGKPARVAQKDNTIEGEKIFLDQAAEVVRVLSPGKIHFLSDTDMSGNKVDIARPVDITWVKSLDYRGKDRNVEVFGDVRLDTAGDTMHCGEMRVLLAPQEKLAAPGALVSRPSSRPALALQPRRIAMVLADKNCRMESVRKDPEGFLAQRILLKSEKVQYDAEARKLTCPTPGTMVAEDYRPPDKKAKGPPADPLGGGSVDRPSQTAFQWAKSMEMDQAQRLVKLAGDVQMAHRGGAEVVLLEKLNVRPWEKLPTGRKTFMNCDRMLAKFAPPPPAPVAVAAAPAPVGSGDSILGASGPQMGPLDLFDAYGNVNLQDGPRQVLCQRLLYERASDIALIYGALPDEAPKDAILYLQEPGKPVSFTRSPKITWYRQTNRIVTEGVTAGGGR